MQFTVACRNNTKISIQAFENILYQIENGLCTFTPIKTKGLHLISQKISRTLRQNLH